jgi:hypothetical protein
VVLRPRHHGADPGAATANLSGKVAEIGYQGDSCRLSVTVGGEAIKVKVPPQLALALHPDRRSRCPGSRAPLAEPRRSGEHERSGGRIRSARFLVRAVCPPIARRALPSAAAVRRGS